MNNKDLRIISVLKDNSRMPIREIAKRTGLRPSTVHQRVKKIRENGVIERFTLKLNDKAMGENFIVFMLVKTKPATILSNIMSDKHVKEVFGITGEYDLILKLKFENVAEFNNFIIKFRKEQKIETTLTMVVTAKVKEEI